MIERQQPVVKGINEKGELIWGTMPMPRWQMEMFRVKYYGDFIGFWLKQTFFNLTGYENEETPNIDFREDAYKYLRKPRSMHQGD